MGRRSSSICSAPTLALTLALVGIADVGCSPLKSTTTGLVKEDAAAVLPDAMGPAAMAGGTGSGRGGRPGWGDEPAVVGGNQGGGSGGSGGSSGGTGGDPWPSETGGAPGNTGGSSGAGGAGGAGGGPPGGGGMPGLGGSLGAGGTGGIQIPGNNSTGTGGSPSTDPPFVPPKASDVCATAPSLPMQNSRMNLPVSTTGTTQNLPSPCGVSGPDVFFSFTIGNQEAVYADTFGSTWNTMVFFAKSCDVKKPLEGVGGVTCNDDACGTTQSQVAAVLPPGKYYLVVSGAQGQTGDTVVHFEHVKVGNGPSLPLGSGTTTVTGTTDGSGTLSFCEAAAAENSYWWTTCPDFKAAPLMSGTCGPGTSFDSVLVLQIPRTGAAFCNDDGCGFQSRINVPVPAGAGIQVLSVDGSTGRQTGAYSLTVTRP